MLSKLKTYKTYNFEIKNWNNLLKILVMFFSVFFKKKIVTNQRKKNKSILKGYILKRLEDSLVDFLHSITLLIPGTFNFDPPS